MTFIKFYVLKSLGYVCVRSLKLVNSWFWHQRARNKDAAVFEGPCIWADWQKSKLIIIIINFNRKSLKIWSCTILYISRSIKSIGGHTTCIYSGRISKELTENTSQSLLLLAEMYDIADLKEECFHFLVTCTRIDNAIDLLVWVHVQSVDQVCTFKNSKVWNK